MLSHKVLTRQEVGRAASYYEDGADDYYAGEGEASAWQGRGAERLGLVGEVESSRFRELLGGRVDPGRSSSRSATRQDAQSRIGIDLTFSAPKSVSLEALVGGDGRIIEAHDRAVAHAIAVAEERAQARRKVKGQSHVEDTRNLVVAKFRYETSRERDPQLHTHALVLNLTRRSDGEWRALRNDEIVKSTKYLGAVYRAELAAELQRLGYALRHERGGLFELAHMERAQLAAFSKRAGQIERRLAAEGLTAETATAAQKQRVKLATRPRKVQADRAVLIAEWHGRGRVSWGSTSRGARGRASRAKTRRRCRPPSRRRRVRAAASGSPSRTSPRGRPSSRRARAARRGAQARGRCCHPRRRAPRGAAAACNEWLPRAGAAAVPIPRMDRPTLQGCRGTAGCELGSPGAKTGTRRERRVDQEIDKGRLVVAERRYTTQTALERERRILTVEREGRGSLAPVATAEVVRVRLASTRLTEGQRAAVELITTSPDRVVGIQGSAGTGKSRMLGAAKTVSEEHGHRVVALAPYAAQVRALRELAVEARPLASFLAGREKPLDEHTVMVIDEAGTVSTRQMEQVLRLAEERGARVVLLGDTRQTKAIEAGRPFEQLQAAGMATAVLGEIQRQKDPVLREAVALAARGEAEASLAKLRHVREIRDDHDRRRAIASEFARLPEEERAPDAGRLGHE